MSDLKLAEQMFNKIRSRTFSRFFRDTDRATVEIYTSDSMTKPLQDPKLVKKAAELFESLGAGGVGMFGTKQTKTLTVLSKGRPNDVIALLSVLLAYEKLIEESPCTDIVIKRSSPPAKAFRPPKSYTKTGDVVFYKSGKGVMTIFLSKDGELLRHPSNPTQIADYVSTVLHEIAHCNTMLAAIDKLGSISNSLLSLRKNGLEKASVFKASAPEWKVLDGAVKFAEATERILKPKDVDVAKVREIAADAWIISKAFSGIWEVLCLRFRGHFPHESGLKQKLAMVESSHKDNIKLCRRGKPPPDLFEDGVVSSMTFEMADR